MKKTVIALATILSTNAYSVGGDDTGVQSQVCITVGSDGAGINSVGQDGTGINSVGQDGTGINNVGQDGTGNKVGSDGTEYTTYCQIISTK